MNENLLNKKVQKAIKKLEKTFAKLDYNVHTEAYGYSCQKGVIVLLWQHKDFKLKNA